MVEFSSEQAVEMAKLALARVETGEGATGPSAVRSPESAEEADTRLTREETFAIDRMIQRHDKEKLEPDLVRDIMWAYRGLDWRNARVQDAPSAGAWSLLKWAREYRNRFFEQMLPKALAAREREKGEGEAEEVKGERKSLEEVARVLRSLEGP